MSREGQEIEVLLVLVQGSLPVLVFFPEAAPKPLIKLTTAKAQQQVLDMKDMANMEGRLVAEVEVIQVLVVVGVGVEARVVSPPIAILGVEAVVGAGGEVAVGRAGRTWMTFLWISSSQLSLEVEV